MTLIKNFVELSKYTANTSRVGRQTSGERAERTAVREHTRIPKFDAPNLEVLKVYSTKYYGLLSTMFTVILLFSNIAEAKICDFFGYAIGAGTTIFPLLYILSDVLTEVYGFSASRKAIWIAFCYSCLFSIFIYIICLLPPSAHWNGQEAFLEIFLVSPRIVIASVLSYFVGELLNTTIIASLKIKLQGKYFAFRAIFSTFFGALLESSLFGFIAFLGRVPFEELINMIIILSLIKVIYEILLMPITTKLVKFLKRAEGINIFEKPSWKNILPYFSR